MKNKKKILGFLLVLFLVITFQFVLTANISQAGTLLDQQIGVKEPGDPIPSLFGDSTTDIRIIIAKILKVFLEFLGIIFLVLIIWAGFKIMTSQGNEEQVTEAKALIKNAIIGIIIIVTAWVITDYITDCVIDVTKQTTNWMCSKQGTFGT